MCSKCFCCYIRNLFSVSTVLRVLKPWAVEKSILRDVLKPNKAMFETTDDKNLPSLALGEKLYISKP